VQDWACDGLDRAGAFANLGAPGREVDGGWDLERFVDVFVKPPYITSCDRPHREFLFAGTDALRHDPHIERGAERAGDLDGNRNVAAPEHSWKPATPPTSQAELGGPGVR